MANAPSKINMYHLACMNRWFRLVSHLVEMWTVSSDPKWNFVAHKYGIACIRLCNDIIRHMPQ